MQFKVPYKGSTEEATVEPTEEATVEPTEEATVEPTEEATVEPEPSNKNPEAFTKSPVRVHSGAVPESQVQLNMARTGPEVRKRKKKFEICDEATRLTNEKMKKSISDASGLLRQKRPLPMDSLASWKHQIRLKKDAVFSDPLITGLSNNLHKSNTGEASSEMRPPRSRDPGGSGTGGQPGMPSVPSPFRPIKNKGEASSGLRPPISRSPGGSGSGYRPGTPFVPSPNQPGTSGDSGASSGVGATPVDEPSVSIYASDFEGYTFENLIKRRNELWIEHVEASKKVSQAKHEEQAITNEVANRLIKKQSRRSDSEVCYTGRHDLERAEDDDLIKMLKFQWKVQRDQEEKSLRTGKETHKVNREIALRFENEEDVQSSFH